MDALFQNGIEVPKYEWHHPSMNGESTMNVTTVWIDLAKNVFQAHGVDEHGKAVLPKKLD